MERLWQIFANLLYLVPLYLLPRLIAEWAGGRGVKPVWGGALSGVAIGGYLAITAYLLFGKLFLSDLAFQFNLALSAFMVAALDRVNLVSGLKAGQEAPLIALMTLVQVLIYGCLGGLVGWALQQRR